MAAVDVDVREATKAAKARTSTSGGSRWRRGEDGAGMHVHEQVVCSIKAHQNGTLEIAPGAHACLSTTFYRVWPRLSRVHSFVFCFFLHSRVLPLSTQTRRAEAESCVSTHIRDVRRQSHTSLPFEIYATRTATCVTTFFLPKNSTTGEEVA